ncbi:unnamed protein product [Cylicocyclus nassatus]|uniref:Sushi domain-containing protein n=1 Tax=Cylicocyclus nassatus TaxID=53992 RepID=A0AA36HCH9_CYLNA|nr:unnamed protein product [Cylicocyclus nassatus]
MALRHVLSFDRKRKKYRGGCYSILAPLKAAPGLPSGNRLLDIQEHPMIETSRYMLHAILFISGVAAWNDWDDWDPMAGLQKECSAPKIPSGVEIDNKGPYPNGATINVKCQGKGYILGPSSMTCVFGNWAPNFFGQCSHGPGYSCTAPQAPEGAHLSRQGPFGNGDSVEAICDKGGYIIGVSSMTCVMGSWAPSFFGECSDGRKYSCEVPKAKSGMSLDKQGVVPSDETVTATCTENMKVLAGIKSMTCVLGHWAPNVLGNCVDISGLGSVVYSDGKENVIVKYHEYTNVSDLGNGELLIKYSSGGYGIEKVKGYKGVPSSEEHRWSIVNGMIERDGTIIPSVGYSRGTVKLSGYEKIDQNSGISNISGPTGVNIINDIVYINGVPVARRINGGSGDVSINNVAGTGFNVDGDFW